MARDSRIAQCRESIEMMNNVAVIFPEHSSRAQTHLVSIMPCNLRDCEAPAATGSTSLRTKLATKSLAASSRQDVLRNEQSAIIPSAVRAYFDFKNFRSLSASLLSFSHLFPPYFLSLLISIPASTQFPPVDDKQRPANLQRNRIVNAHLARRSNTARALKLRPRAESHI